MINRKLKTQRRWGSCTSEVEETSKHILKLSQKQFDFKAGKIDEDGF